MSLVIRLKRIGAKNRPFFRIVVAEKRSKIKGENVEEIGYYNPLEKPPVVNLNRQKLEGWLKKGAQLSAAVSRILEK
jgi:small subunit ribosomal protein S16